MPSAARQQWPAVKYTQTSLGGGTNAQGAVYPGGLDLMTPSLRLQPGALRDVLNFEVGQFGGYARVDGYERVDGRPSPSAATYAIVQLSSFTQIGDFDSDFDSDFESTGVGLDIPAVGTVVTQPGSGASGQVIAVVTEPEPYVVLTKVHGAFDENSVLGAGVPLNQFIVGVTPMGGLTSGVAIPTTVMPSARDRAIYTAAAADIYRADIEAVPGDGPILGVVAMAFHGGDQLYAFRADMGRQNAFLWKASPAGWVQVPYFNLISFTGGAAVEPQDGDILIQGGGGGVGDFVIGDTLIGGAAVTATIKRVMWQDGIWATQGAGTASGQFVISDLDGGAFSAGTATTSSGATLTLTGPMTPITMAARGRFEFEKCNFSGQLITRRIYGCDGVNPAFEFDGETLAPIKTGLVPDRPSHIRFHKNSLFLAQDASLLCSASGSPFKWSAVDGAVEIATGDTVTGMITLPGSQTTATLGVFMRTNTAFLYGTDPSTFNFVTFNTGIGAVPHSMQNLFDTFFLDDLGVVTLKTTLNYGNFLPNTLTDNLRPFIKRERGNLVASAVNREKSQYRLFFKDGFALHITVLNQHYLGAGVVLYPNRLTCVDTTNLETDEEVTYAGGVDGFVYQLDIGTSFDGAAIPAYIKTAIDPVKSPRILKRFRAASVEVQGDTFAEIQYGYRLGYDSDQLAQLPEVTLPINLGGVTQWDSGFTWDAFLWDGHGLTPTDIDETGTAENIQVIIKSDTNYIASYTLNSVIHHYSLRRGMRV